jgi:hypothetical protein
VRAHGTSFSNIAAEYCATHQNVIDVDQMPVKMAADDPAGRRPAAKIFKRR